MTTISTSPAPLSGHQYEIRLDDQRVVITDVGAKVRVYRVGDRDVFTPYPAEVPSPAGHGALLAPWPNRLRDGRYTWDGVEHQVALSEPGLATALHGLVMWQRWSVVEQDTDPAALTLELRPAPSPGYPFDLLLRVTYRLTVEGLHVTATATNLGEAAAPYGIGFHPWLSPGPGTLDECTVRIDAAELVTVDDRLLPTGTVPVSGEFNLREPRSALGLDLDHAFLSPLYDADGRSWIRLTGADGRTAAVWMDESFAAWQSCTGDHLGAEEWRRTGLAAEPQTCVADAFNTGDLLVRLEPGTTHEVTWGAGLFD